MPRPQPLSASIEHFADEHAPAVAALHRRTFGSRVGAADLRHKYDTRHVGVEHAAFVALAGERAVAFHGGLPQLFEADGRAVLVGQSCDSMAAPETRGSGIYTQLFRRTEELMQRHGAALMYGVGNRAGLQAGLRMGWTDPGYRLNRYTWTVRTAPVARLMWRFPRLRTLLPRWAAGGLAACADSLDGFRNSLADRGFLVHRYTPELIAHKLRGGSFGAQVGPVRLWLKAQPDLMVGDLAAPDGPALAAALQRVAAAARRRGLGAVHCFTHPDAPLDPLLAALQPRQEGHGFVVSGWGDQQLAPRLRFQVADLDSF